MFGLNELQKELVLQHIVPAHLYDPMDLTTSIYICIQIMLSFMQIKHAKDWCISNYLFIFLLRFSRQDKHVKEIRGVGLELLIEALYLDNNHFCSFIDFKYAPPICMKFAGISEYLWDKIAVVDKYAVGNKHKWI